MEISISIMLERKVRFCLSYQVQLIIFSRSKVILVRFMVLSCTIHIHIIGLLLTTRNLKIKIDSEWNILKINILINYSIILFIVWIRELIIINRKDPSWLHVNLIVFKSFLFSQLIELQFFFHTLNYVTKYFIILW